MPCPECVDTSDDDIFGKRSNYAYCSVQCLDADRAAHAPICKERKLWRTLVRIGALCNMLLMCREMTMNYVRIKVTFVDSDGIRVIIAHHRDARPGEYWCDQPMPTETILGAVSFDHCRVAVGLLSPVLAWLLDGLYTADLCNSVC